MNTPLEQKYDAVLVEGFEVEASIGVFDWEKEIRQKLVFDLTLYSDFTNASLSDDIQDAVNYVSVCDMIEAITLGQHHQLLETLADKISSQLLKSFSIQSLLLSIRKPGAVPKAKQVGVQVYRTSSNDAQLSLED